MFFGQLDLKESSRRTFILNSSKKKLSSTTENTNMLLENLTQPVKDLSTKQSFEREAKDSST